LRRLAETRMLNMVRLLACTSMNVSDDVSPARPRDPPPLHRSYGGFESAEALFAKAESGDPGATKQDSGFPLTRE
jgi:hypothetical protein